eukprot:scaffold16462_cov78-Skeletonema_dohrnii-CCMP3373.AAC.2
MAILEPIWPKWQKFHADAASDDNESVKNRANVFDQITTREVVIYINITITPRLYNPFLFLAVDCHIHSVRYDGARVVHRQPSQIGPHQVTYDATL